MTDAKHSYKNEKFSWLTPALTVADIPTAVSFYESAFGFNVDMQMPDDDGKITYANMRYKDEVVIMLMRQGGWGSDARAPADSKESSAVSLYVYCENVNELCQQARAAKAEILCEPEDMFWGDRTCVMTDPEGHRWTFATMIPNFVAPKMENA